MALSAVTSEAVKRPVSLVRKHEFMTEPPTVAPLGVPGIRIAPTPPLPSLVGAPPQLMLRLKKWAQQFPTEMLFTHAQPNVRNVLQLTRLDQLLLEGGQ